MLSIVPQQLFIEHRRLFYLENKVKFGFSLSLEYAIYALLLDFLRLDVAKKLASKARMLLDMEISGNVPTLGSMQASILLGWWQCGSEKSLHFCTKAVGLAVYFGINIGPPHSTSFTEMSKEEEEARRLMCWSLFAFDR
jgi:hypothetical protein